MLCDIKYIKFGKTRWRFVLPMNVFLRYWSFVFVHCPQPGNKHFYIYFAKRLHWDLGRKQFTSDGLNEERLMKGLLQTCGQGDRNKQGVVQHPGTSSNGKPLPPPGRGTRGANSGARWGLQSWRKGHWTGAMAMKGHSCFQMLQGSGERAGRTAPRSPPLTSPSLSGGPFGQNQQEANSIDDMGAGRTWPRVLWGRWEITSKMFCCYSSSPNDYLWHHVWGKCKAEH